MSFNSNRTAISSEDYVQKLANAPKLSRAEKQAHLDKLMQAPNSWQRLGQGLIGPIQIRLRYEGLVRNVLQEDPLDRGPIMPYDVLDELGMAYVLHSTDSEVKVQMFEGRQVPVTLFRIASFPKVRKEDLHYLRVNIVEYAQDESRQAIQKQEDFRLVTLLEKAITDWGAAGISPTGGAATGLSAGPSGAANEKTVVIGANSPLEFQDLQAAAAMVEIEQNEADTVLAHPQDVRDVYTWDLNQMGWGMKDDVMAGKKVMQVGEFTLRKSVMIPQGELFLTAEPKNVGVMPVMYSLDVEENHRVEQFHKGWVMDELIGMAILNARGLARIVKEDTYGAIGSPIADHNIQNRGIEQ